MPRCPTEAEDVDRGQVGIAQRCIELTVFLFPSVVMVRWSYKCRYNPLFRRSLLRPTSHPVFPLQPSLTCPSTTNPSTMASLYLLLTFTASLCAARVIERATPEGIQYAQVRFMDCANSGHVIGHYGTPSHGADPPQTVFASWAHGPVFSMANWEMLCGEKHMTVNEKTMQCELRDFALSEPTDTYLGEIAYQGERYNCFKDDGHAVHKDPIYGQCGSTIYCNHESANIENGEGYD